MNLAADGWQIEVREHIIGHGGCGVPVWLAANRFDNELLRESSALRYARQPVFGALMHRTG
jgi:hypothetical protein